MQNYFQREAITATKKMIRAFYIVKNVEGSLKFFSREHLTFIGIGENEIFTSFNEVRNYFYKFVDTVTSTYKVISEDYHIVASSYDSCIIVAKIGFQGNASRIHQRFALHFSFYFQLVDDKLLITFAHVHMPEKNCDEKTLHADTKLRKDLLSQFENTNYIAAKNVLYKDNLPYCYINDLFLKLLGYKKINIENYSSLANIHPNDQQRYFDYLHKIFKEKSASVSEGWRWHNSYRVIYRLVNCNYEEIKVLEWGNLLSLNGNFIFNSFVAPLDKIEILGNIPSPRLATFLDGSQKEVSALLNDCGIHIGNILLIYPRRHKLFINGKLVLLTPIEFDLLLVLVAHLNTVLTTKEIYKNLWDKEELNDTSFTLKTHVSNLRKKLRDASEHKIHLHNCKGDGYCLSISEP